MTPGLVFGIVLAGFGAWWIVVGLYRLRYPDWLNTSWFGRHRVVARLFHLVPLWPRNVDRLRNSLSPTAQQIDMTPAEEERYGKERTFVLGAVMIIAGGVIIALSRF